MTDTPTVKKATASDVGCWIAGSYGQYAGAMMVMAAQTYGYPNVDDYALALQHYNAMDMREPALTDDEHQRLTDALDDVQEWLNDHVAQPGHFFGWSDGEFLYQPDGWWDE